MVSVDEARAIVREQARPLLETESVPLAAALGRVLFEPVVADRDDPPFDRALMDGYALRAEDTAGAPRALDVVGRIAAGDADLPSIGPEEAAWINTGAPMPPGADAVIPVERTRGEVEVLAVLAPGANVLPRASLMAAGSTAAEPGRLTPERIAVCASAGADPVVCRRRPSVAVLATGTELRASPGKHEIRNSNGPLLRALFDTYEPTDLGAVGDDRAALRAALERGLASDLLVTTGGVSMGDLDLVPSTLEDLGVEILFHRILLQPGKPVLFGRHARGHVVALPGNPVSALVCADLFALPFLAARAGHDFEAALRTVPGQLTGAVKASPKRQRVFPCVRGDTGDVMPLPWRSSADLYTVTRGNAYMIVEIARDLAVGEEVQCLVPERF
ncbi:MAG: molybdopterin molybdotransferase MoeA [Planctomycetota bacterium]|nr:molybdopterin molybdotransferase MoeA [Planctomycetota bacterium]